MVFALILASNIIINEIAWMGTSSSANDEWIELYNTTENNITLDGWVLRSDDGTPEINLAGMIPGQGFYLLERTDDETVPGISADLIYKGALANNGENLKLFDNLGNLIDVANFKDGWPAGDNKTKQTMERARDGEWQTSGEREGTPKIENSLIEVRPPQIEASKPAEVGPPPSYPTGIVLNEILPSPEGQDTENEWIEIFNQNDFEVDLSQWQIQDTIGKTTTFTLNSKIPAFGYLVLKRPETKITLNNSQDGLNLLYPNGEIADSISFEKAPLAQSYNKTSAGWKWSTILTPGAENVLPPTKQPQPLPPSQSPEQKLPEDGPRETETAAIRQTLSKPKNYALFVALAIAIISAIIILFLKKTRANQSR